MRGTPTATAMSLVMCPTLSCPPSPSRRQMTSSRSQSQWCDRGKPVRQQADMEIRPHVEPSQSRRASRNAVRWDAKKATGHFNGSRVYRHGSLPQIIQTAAGQLGHRMPLPGTVPASGENRTNSDGAVEHQVTSQIAGSPYKCWECGVRKVTYESAKSCSRCNEKMRVRVMRRDRRQKQERPRQHLSLVHGQV